MDIDDVYRDVVGEFGRYQRLIFFAVTSFEAFLAMHMVQNVFVGAEPDSIVCITDNGTRYLSRCPALNESTVKCESFLYNESTFNSIASEWDLVCDHYYIAGIVQSIFMTGVLVGALGFGTLTDKFGRLKCLFVAVGGVGILGFASSFSPNYWVYIVLRFMTGLNCGGMLLLCFGLPAELVGPSKRCFGGTIMPIIFACGIILYSGLGYLIRDWRHLSIASSVPGVLCVFLYWIVPESPRWLLSQGRIQEAQELLTEMAKKNRNPVKSPIVLRPLEAPEKTYNITDLLRIKALRKLTILQVYGWFADSFGYYGLTMSAGELGGNRYLNVAISGLVEMPALLSLFFLLQWDKFGRRISYAGFMVVGGVACIIILILPQGISHLELGVKICAMLGKLAIAGSFAVAFLYSAELFPTEIRNNGLGAASMGARFGGIIAPLVMPLSKVYPSLHFLVFGVIAFSAGCLSFLLPETLNRHMPETIDDLVLLQKKNQLMTPDGSEESTDAQDDTEKV